MAYGAVLAIKYSCFGPFPPRLGRPALERKVLFVLLQVRGDPGELVEQALFHGRLPSEKRKGITKFL